MGVQIVVPVRNEGENVLALWRRLRDCAVHFDSLRFVFDDVHDSTVPFIGTIASDEPRARGELNELGPGVVNVFRWILSRAEDGPLIVVMGDNSDKVSLIDAMVAMWADGATIVAPSRYAEGGRQHGGGAVKSTLSRIAGRSLKWAGFPVSDPTNNFKLYDGAWAREQTLQCRGGFAVALELCYKAYDQGKRLGELPTVWIDRTSGSSSFRLLRWLPSYLYWYLLAMRRLIARRVRDLLGVEERATES